MNRKPRFINKLYKSPELLSDWHQHLATRRQFLLTTAGGSLTVMFPLSSIATTGIKQKIDPWKVIDAVQLHLFPTEAQSPGANEINALGYLKNVATDNTLDASNRAFITKGASWLEVKTQQTQQKSFITLGVTDREKVLRQFAESETGENWLSTILLYIVEALLTDPVYSGNTNRVGWIWLEHVPGFPRPPIHKIFQKLLT